MKPVTKQMMYDQAAVQRVLAVFVAMALLWTFQSRADALSISDSLGNRLVLEKPPTRIVSLVPTATEVIFALGAEDAVVGVTYHDATLQGATGSQDRPGKAVVGGFFRPSIEKIKALDPDLIIVSSLHQPLVESLGSDTYRFFHYGTKDLAQSFENIRTMGRILGKWDEAEALIQKNQDEIAHIDNKIAAIFRDPDVTATTTETVTVATATPNGESGERIKEKEKGRKRVIRLMGRDQIMTPGNDSFQNDLIRMAGGIPPDFGKSGSVVPVTKDEWLAFNPEVIYGCGDDREAAERFFSQEGWKDVDAVKHQRIFYFPCELTCRAATHTGYFVSWLSSMIYMEEFAVSDHFVSTHKGKKNGHGGRSVPPDHGNNLSISTVKKSRSLSIDLPYIKAAAVNTVSVFDFDNKTLMIDFKTPQTIVSTLEGERDGILTVGNHYSPPPTWGPGHYLGIEAIREAILGANGKKIESTSFLMTGANMDNLSVKEAIFKELKVVAVATAGVMSNAVRMAKDTGKYYEPGTINVIVMSSMPLSKRAMTRAIISATEAKSAALDDLDIRSTYSPLINPATGTGTDNVLVVQGEGSYIERVDETEGADGTEGADRTKEADGTEGADRTKGADGTDGTDGGHGIEGVKRKKQHLDNAGGHSKLGELVAKAVYDAVQDAILKQNGVTASRHVFQRLKERKISVYGLSSAVVCECMKEYKIEKGRLAETVEHLLIEPEYAGFIEAALALSDDAQRGLVKNLELFDAWCRMTASDIAGKPVTAIENLVEDDHLPTVLKKALNALFTGALEKLRNE